MVVVRLLGLRQGAFPAKQQAGGRDQNQGSNAQRERCERQQACHEQHTHTSHAGQELKCLRGCGPPPPVALPQSLKPPRRREKKRVLACLGVGGYANPGLLHALKRVSGEQCVEGVWQALAHKKGAHQHTKATKQLSKHDQSSSQETDSGGGRGREEVEAHSEPKPKQQILLCLLRICFFSYQCHTHTDTPVSLPDLPLSMYHPSPPSLPPSLPP